MKLFQQTGTNGSIEQINGDHHTLKIIKVETSQSSFHCRTKMKLIVAKISVAAALGVVRFAMVYFPIKIFNVIHGGDKIAADGILDPKRQRR